MIGLCGRSGSGKTMVSSILARQGVYTIDADDVCRRLYRENAECIFELAESFGKDIVCEKGIDRALLSKRAFANEDSLKTLNAIAHKYIINEILNEASNAFRNGSKFVVVDAPTLFESGLYRHCDAVISVFSSKTKLYARLKKREGITKDGFTKRINAQKSNRFLVTNSNAVIKNTGALKDLKFRTNRAMLLVHLKLGVIKSQEERKQYVLKTK